MKLQKFLFILLWLIAVLVGPITVLLNTQLNLLSTNSDLLINFIQRMLATIAFALLLSQITLGNNMEWFINKFGPGVFSWHVTEGLTVYGILILHPSMQFLRDFNNEGLRGAFVYLLPFTRQISYDLGKLAFLLLTIAVAAGYFRKSPLLRRNWRKFHILNYLLFFVVAIHSFLLGTDTKSWPFLGLYIIGIVLVLTISLKRFIFPLFAATPGGQENKV